jgi:exosortase D (VPLPA-CTERM-specific)
MSLFKTVSSGFWLRLTVYCALILGVYWGAFTYMFSLWQNEDFNYCLFVPVIVAYLIWEKRVALSNLPTLPDFRGMLALLAGLSLFWLGELGGEYTILFISAWLVVVGLVWLEFGWTTLKLIGTPVLFSLAMFPLPSMLASSLTLKLKLISSWLGVKMLHWYGMSAYREGNVIDLGFTRLQVVDACSGLRFFFPLLLLGFLLAYFYKDQMWKRVLLTLSAIPVSILTNGLRIALVGILYPVFGPKVAEGFFHDFSGWFIFMASLGILLVEMWLLKRVLPKPKGAPRVSPLNHEQVSTGSVQEETPFFSWRPQLMRSLAVLLLMSTLVFSTMIEFREKVPLKRSFAGFPDTVGQWQGHRQAMESVYLDVLNLGDYLLIDFKDPQGTQIHLYVAYNESQSKGKSAHSPSTCLPGGGWLFKESGIVSVALTNGGKLEVQRAVMEKTGQKQVSYYWFAQRGRVLHNLYQLKFYAFWDALTKQRTDGALVRIISPVGGTETVESAEQRLQVFTRQVAPLLDQYLPGRSI